MVDAAGPPVDSQHLRMHAANVDRLRSRLTRVRRTGQQIESDQAGFGALCGWVLTGLSDRYARSDELIAYVEETLLLFVQGLRRVAAGEETLAELVGMSDEPAEPYDEPRSATEIIDSVLETIASREWVEPLLADAVPVGEFAAPVSDAYHVLRAAGLDAAMTRVEPLRQMLDDLTGTPSVVAKQADHWTVMAADLRGLAVDLDRAVTADLAARDRADVRAYRAKMAYNVEALRGLAATSTAMTVLTRAAGDLILLTRDIVRGLIGDLFARVALWAADTSTVVPLPVLTARLAFVVVTAWRIDAYLEALVTSIANLSTCIDG